MQPHKLWNWTQSLSIKIQSQNNNKFYDADPYPLHANCIILLLVSSDMFK